MRLIHHATDLRELNVSRSAKLFSCLGDPSKLGETLPVMPSISLLDVGWSPNVWLPKHIQWQASMREVSLAGTSLSNTDLSVVISCCPHLEKLNLQECFALGDLGIDALSELKKLKELDISKCMKIVNPVISAPALEKLFCRWSTNCSSLTFNCPLRVLDVSGCGDLGASFLSSLANSGLFIEHLWMKRNGGVTDELLERFSQNCPALRVVNISESSSFSLASLSALVESCRLDRIYLNNCEIEGLTEFIDSVEKKNPFITITKHA
jgi:hypothetical protein